MRERFFSKREQTQEAAIDPELSRQLKEARSIMDDIEQSLGSSDREVEQAGNRERIVASAPPRLNLVTAQESNPASSSIEMEAVDPDWLKAANRLCIMKAEEFAVLGYTQVTAEEIWECVSSRYQKTGKPPLHQMVNDILTLKVPDFMNWMTLQAFKGVSF